MAFLIALSSSGASMVRLGDTVDHAAGRIRQLILAGAFAPGQRLIARQLVDGLGISRSTLREALNRLCAEGLVDLVPNQGAIVHSFSLVELRELFQLREVLEGLAAFLAATNAGKDQNQKRLGRTLQKLCRTNKLDSSEFCEANSVFHLTILEMAGNTRLRETLDRLKLPLIMLRMRSAMSETYIKASLAEHHAIAKEILAGKPHAAEAAMRMHLRQAAERALFAASPFGGI